jgi:cob(I)alamin adenosyltransferase
MVLMKIYTRKGDKGNTSLIGGDRVDKDSPRIEAYGTVDELSSALGFAISRVASSAVRETLARVQTDLFPLCVDLARVGGEGPFRIQTGHWEALEASIDEFEERLPALRHFVFPGGSTGAATVHMARAVCRRAERRVVRAMKDDPTINPQALAYLNRLSDLLFVLARYENQEAGGQETIWKGGR